MKPRMRLLQDRGRWLSRIWLVTDELGQYTMHEGWRTDVRRPPAKDWRDTIRVGDVLTNGRSFRVVREATYREDGYLVSASFTIKHCSWTGRCYTALNRTDLKSFGYRKAGVRVRLDSKFDAKVLENIRTQEKTLDCCDVRGIA